MENKLQKFSTLEQCLEQFEYIKYKAFGFPVIMIDYNYNFKKWGICFRNPSNFDNPNIQEDTPLEACYKMIDFLNDLSTAENPTNDESSVVDKIEDDTINLSPAYIVDIWGKPLPLHGLTPTYKEVPCCAVCENTMIVYPMASTRPYCNICNDLVDEGTTKILI